MELHAAIAFGSALAGAAVLGPIGAVLALPFAAMVQAVASDIGQRHEVIDNPLVTVQAVERRRVRRTHRT
jgi:predicted PurR-regulated permease PerM